MSDHIAQAQALAATAGPEHQDALVEASRLVHASRRAQEALERKDEATFDAAMHELDEIKNRLVLRHAA